MFVGETGVGRVIQRTCDVMNEHRTDDVRRFGVVALPLLQKYLNFHFSVSVDLFGSELSTNAANYFTQGLKGRYQEAKLDDDHLLENDSYQVTDLDGESFRNKEEPALLAINERLRDDYIADCQKGVKRWNRIIEAAGIDFRLRLPHRAFHRAIGQFADLQVTPEGKVVTQAEWDARHRDWLPTDEDRAYVKSLMGSVTEAGKMANWIAPPAHGIKGRPVDFEYVRFN